MHSVVFLDGLFNLPLAGKEKKEKKNVSYSSMTESRVTFVPWSVHTLSL